MPIETQPGNATNTIQPDMTGLPETQSKPMSQQSRSMLPATKGEIEQITGSILALTSKIDRLNSDLAELRNSGPGVDIDAIIDLNNLKRPAVPGQKTKFSRRK